MGVCSAAPLVVVLTLVRALPPSEAIAINHAWQGSPGTMHKTLLNKTVEIWSKPLPESKVAILVLNTLETDVTLTLTVADDVPGKPQGATMRDVWAHKDVPITGGQVPCKLRAHASLLAVLAQTASGA